MDFPNNEERLANIRRNAEQMSDPDPSTKLSVPIIDPLIREAVLDQVVLFLVKKSEDISSDESCSPMERLNASKFDESAAEVVAMGASSGIVDAVIDRYLNAVKSWIDHQNVRKALRLASTRRASPRGIARALDGAIMMCWVDQAEEMAILLGRPLTKEEFLALFKNHIEDSSLEEKRGEKLLRMALSYSNSYLSMEVKVDLREQLRQKKKESEDCVY